MEKIKVKFKDEVFEVDKGIKFKDFLLKYIIYSDKDYRYLGFLYNNKLANYEDEIVQDGNLELIDYYTNIGRRIYQIGLSFILAKAVSDLYPEANLYINHSMGNSFYCEVYCSKFHITEDDLLNIENRMREIIDAKEEIVMKRLSYDEAINKAKEYRRDDLLRLFKYNKKDYYDLYFIQDYIEYSVLPLPHNTYYFKVFSLQYNPPGFVLTFPKLDNRKIVDSFRDIKKLSKIFLEHERWAKLLDVEDVGKLNQLIADGKIEEIIQVSEALQEKKIAYIADLITKRRGTRLVLIAGPSSSGKTTFSKRLQVQLKVNGLKPITISLDNYFVDREKTPKDEEGNYDFESLYALDLDLINEQILDLIKGKEVEIPKFDFKAGKRKKEGRKMRINSNQIIIIEGIHGLNEKLTYLIPSEKKYKIYVSALTQLNIDRHLRIPTTDNRLIRRMVRDNFFRGNSSLKTLRMWHLVRRGEDRNIFPFQETADIMFNSALIYELAILSRYALKLLKEVPDTEPEYIEAQRLIKFLSLFLQINEREEKFIPPTSIVREFIGGSSFHY